MLLLLLSAKAFFPYVMLLTLNSLSGNNLLLENCLINYNFSRSLTFLALIVCLLPCGAVPCGIFPTGSGDEKAVVLVGFSMSLIMPKVSQLV